ncbi:hypothetical protein [Amycolatopsis sp. FDAARGOS 1241]|uniref:hypothetical protein n=1 Tax=Amycolatopsis sp. FDAARGOS 1241 TaxID=2778070 RepID=UPI00194EAFDD|nr:hypothetical protein [Amycolatopsis sp. FDAARGOS 1241]QRP45774.1 hypothetical protein I6J71_42945 [Amycolatopsis sp. FDAARGOS 1241]
MVRKNKPTDEEMAKRHGMTAEQWRHAKAQTKAARDRGKRPASAAGAETKLAGWGPVEGQEQLFAYEHNHQ